MVRRRPLLASLLTGSLLLTAGACTFGKPAAGPTGQTGATGTVAATSTAATSTAAAKPASLAPAHMPAYDPVLASGSWGIVSRSHAGIKDSSARTDTKRDVIKQDQINDLTTKQSKDLLAIFKRSSVVKSLIVKHGGTVGQTTFYVRSILANADTGVDTAWVTATLRADFPAKGGRKGIEVDVYRQKTSRGLDDHPYVIGTLVGYLATDDSLVSPKSLKFKK